MIYRWYTALEMGAREMKEKKFATTREKGSLEN